METSCCAEIRTGDSIVLRALLENMRKGGQLGPIEVSPSSPGGSYSEGIKIARVLAETGTGTRLERLKASMRLLLSGRASRR